MTKIVPMGMETCKDVITVSAEKTDITLIMNTCKLPSIDPRAPARQMPSCRIQFITSERALPVTTKRLLYGEHEGFGG